MNKKGQALIEFIIILPIFLFMILAVIDFGMISYKKNSMENVLNEVSEMYLNNESFDEINDYIRENDLSIDYKEDDKYITIELNNKYEFITPGMSNLILPDYIINVERTIYK